ncbi:MAG: hypothetical protein KME27_12905 [Lyngbya sp. HA4199-MV5]|nr:hypothetical protein [Lyngbya sp. HA4199-MV5]
MAQLAIVEAFADFSANCRTAEQRHAHSSTKLTAISRWFRARHQFSPETLRYQHDRARPNTPS